MGDATSTAPQIIDDQPLLELDMPSTLVLSGCSCLSTAIFIFVPAKPNALIGLIWLHETLVDLLIAVTVNAYSRLRLVYEWV